MAEVMIGNVMTQHTYRSLRHWAAIERKQTQLGEVQHRLQQAMRAVGELNAEVIWWREWWFGHEKPGYHEKPANGQKNEQINDELVEGFNKDSFSNEGFDKEGYNKEGLDKYDPSKEGYRKTRFDTNGFNTEDEKEGFRKERLQQRGLRQRGFR